MLGRSVRVSQRCIIRHALIQSEGALFSAGPDRLSRPLVTPRGTRLDGMSVHPIMCFGSRRSARPSATTGIAPTATVAEPSDALDQVAPPGRP